MKRRNAGRKSFEIYIRKSRTESPERGKDSLANKEANHPLQTGKLASPDRVGHWLWILTFKPVLLKVTNRGKEAAISFRGTSRCCSNRKESKGTAEPWISHGHQNQSFHSYRKWTFLIWIPLLRRKIPITDFSSIQNEQFHFRCPSLEWNRLLCQKDGESRIVAIRIRTLGLKSNWRLKCRVYRICQDSWDVTASSISRLPSSLKNLLRLAWAKRDIKEIT